MENIVFDRNYELTSEDNGYADAVYEKAIEPDGFFASFGKKMDAIPEIIVPEDKVNYEYLLERCDQFAQEHHGRIHAVVDYQHFHSEINLYLRMIEFDCEEDMSLLKEIGEKAHYVCITPEENCGFRIHIMINYFQELMTDEQYDYLKYETIMENEGMAELLKMPELTQEQLEAALIIKSILDRFDTETKVDRTTAFKAVLDHMGQTKEEGMNLNRMIDLLEKLLQAVLNEKGE